MEKRRQEFLENIASLVLSSSDSFVKGAKKEGVSFEEIHVTIYQSGYLNAYNDIFCFSMEEISFIMKQIYFLLNGEEKP